MNPKPRLLIATNNTGKFKEIQSILGGLEIELVSPADIGLNLDVEEDGQTYAQNAIKKARTFSQVSQLVSLADDTGLEVDVLDGKPGLHSNRFGPLPHTDASRRAHLLEKLREFPPPWEAKFRATVAISSPESGLEVTEGVCPGEIIPNERGTGGFGYDPIFQLKGLEKTMAELGMDEKNRLSHRGLAVRSAIPIIIAWLDI
jgi:XTP/dITP diphosphohydrolase